MSIRPDDTKAPTSPPPPAADPAATTLLPSLPAVADAAPLPSLPGYEILRELGCGGMGVVYFGVETALRRPVAVKVLRRHLADEPEMVARFEAEARICAQLQHPGIVPVHLVGRLDDGRPFYVMKLVKGDTLADLLAKRSSPSADLLTFLSHFGKVCEAMAYAHAHQVLHRDLKPANVMVGAYGEVLLMDWGLAKVLGEGGAAPALLLPASRRVTLETAERGLTAASPNAILGTLAYMPPEQAGGGGEVDTRSDVFGLGAILCTILTGQPPYVGPTEMAVLAKAVQADLDDAERRLQQCGADVELTALARQCLSREREDRPADAGVAAKAVADYLARVQERLRRAELDRHAAEVRAREERKRRRIAYRLGAVIGALMLVLAAVGWWVMQTRMDRERQELRARQGVETLLDQVDQALAAGDAGQAEASLKPVQERLADLAAPDLQQRLAGAEKDVHMLRDLDELFHRRWQVLQRVIIQQVLAGKRDDVVTSPELKLVSAVGAAGGSREELRRDYASTFEKYGIAVGQAPLADCVERVNKSRIRVALVGGLDQWFLLEPESQALLDDLNALDEAGRSVRRALAKRAAGAPAGPEPAGNEQELGPTAVLSLSELLPEDRAINLLKAAYGRFPSDHRLLTVLVYRLLLAQDQCGKEVLSYARTANALQPTNSYACLTLAVALSRDKNWDDVIRQAEQAVSLDESNAFACYYVGFAHNQKAEYDKAIPWLQKAVELDPKNVEAHHELGYAYIQTKQYDKAIPQWNQAIELDPQQAAFYDSLGWIYNEQGEFDRAIPFLTKAVAVDPKYVPARNNLGNSYFQKKSYDEAVKWYKEAIDIDPKDVYAHECLGQAYIEKKEYDEAARSFAAAVQIDPSDADYQRNLLSALAGAGRIRDAVAAVDAARPSVKEEGWPSVRYEAARVSALGGCGQGDAAGMAAADRLRLRKQALSWLRDELKDSAALADSPGADSRLKALHTLRQLLDDEGFAGLRDQKSLDALGPGEHDEWRQFWADVENLLKKAEASAPAP